MRKGLRLHIILLIHMSTGAFGESATVAYRSKLYMEYICVDAQSFIYNWTRVVLKVLADRWQNCLEKLCNYHPTFPLFPMCVRVCGIEESLLPPWL